MAATLYDRFVTNVLLLMESRGISQKELAARMKCSPSYVSQILSGYRIPTLETVENVAKSLGVDPSQLFFEKYAMAS